MSDTTNETQKEEAEVAQMEAFTANVLQMIGAAGMSPAMASFALLWTTATVIAELNGKARKIAPKKLASLIDNCVQQRKRDERSAD